jgi:hypothetical protein
MYSVSNQPIFCPPNHNSSFNPRLYKISHVPSTQRFTLVDSIYRGGIDKKSHVSHNKLFGREVFISLEWLRFVEVFVLGESHNMVKKNFETEMWVNGEKLPLNHFVQETVANVLLGFSKTLKGLDTVPENMEVKIRKLSKPVEVDAHTYP